MTSSSGLAHVVPAPAEATTARALARALAASGVRGEAASEALATVDAPDDDARTETEAMLASVPEPREAPGPLRNPAVLEEIGSRKLLSANSLEGWIECSYRWFVQHELTPQRLEPQPDPLWLGSVVHEALHRLYLEAPGADSIPRPGDVRRWVSRFSELLDEEVERSGSPAANVPRKIALARSLIQIEAFLVTESESETELRPRPDLLEVGFGFQAEEGSEEEPLGPLDLGEVALRGRIDRVDISPDGSTALLRDYKTGRKVTGAPKVRDEGKLQIQLYMLAVRKLLGIEPVGGLYQPLGANRKSERKPRGMVRKDADMTGFDLVSTDLLEPEAFEDELDHAAARAADRGRAMLGGEIKRDPLGGRCSRYCTFQAICRLERAVGAEGSEGS